MISELLHTLHTGSDEFLDGLTLPDGSLGNALYGVLNLPGALVLFLENVVTDFGS